MIIMSKTTISVLVVFILYVLMMVGVGLFFFRKKMSNADYVLGGRSLNPWVTAMSAQASDMSGWLLTGLPGLAFASILGAKEAIFTAIGLLIGTILNWCLVAKRLRVYTEVSNNSLTISSYLANRFKEKSGLIKVLSAVVICVFFTVYAASMFSASAKLFSTVFNMNYTIALTIGVVGIVAYVLLGGFLAVSWTDLFQGLLMFFALILVPILVYKAIGDGGQATLKVEFSEIMNLFSSGTATSFGWMGIASALCWGLGYFGMPHILTRFMAIESHKKVKPAIIIAVAWVTITLFASVLVGIFGRYVAGTAGADTESIFMILVLKLFPPIIAGILLAAILAAIMSTADSQLLVASTSISNDVYGYIYTKVKKKEPTDKQYMWVARITVIVLSLIGYVIALDSNSSVFKLVQYAWGGLGSAFGPVMLFSLYFKKLNKYGAISSIAVGAITTIIFKYGLSTLGGLWAIYELIPGFILSTIALFAVSAATNEFISNEDKDGMGKEYDEVVSIIKEK